jgi:hemoglobin-like flavoprotein
LQQGLGASFTPDIGEAWERVYGVIAAAMQAGAAEIKRPRVASRR